jgi:phage shock protein A
MCKLRFDQPSFLHLTGLTLACLFVVGGCSSGTVEKAVTHDGSHDSKDAHPETYEEAVEALASIDETIKTAFAANDEDTAHGPLHEIGHVLEDITELAQKADLTDEQRQSVKTEVDKLFEEYGSVDAIMHGKEGKTYDEASSQIAASLKILKGLGSTAEQEGSTDE